MTTTTRVANQSDDIAPLSISRTTIILTILTLLTIVGVLAGVGRIFFGLGRTTALTDSYPWGIWIGFDFLLIAFSGAGFTMAGVVHVLHLEKYQPVIRPAILAGLMGYVAVLLLLVLDLGRPDRFYHFLIFWNPHSPLFEVSWCIFLYTLVLFIESSPPLFERLKLEQAARWIHRLIGPIAIIGVTLSSLHQSTLGTLYLNMPHRLNALWYTPFLPELFFISSIMAGLSVAIVAYWLACRVHGKAVQPAIVSGLAYGIAWVSLFYIVCKLADIVVAGEWPLLFSFNLMSQLFWWELGLGAIVPMILLFIPQVRAHRWGQGIGLLLILFGVFINRFNATLFAQTLPPGSGLYIPHIAEWLSTLGVIAGVTLVWYWGVRLLVTFESKPHH